MADSHLPNTGSPSRRARTAVFLLLPFLASPPSATAHPGWGIVVDRSATVYVTDLEHVWRIDPAGAARIFVPDVHTHDLVLDPSGDLYGEDVRYEERTGEWRTRIWRASPAGVVIDVVPFAPSPPRGSGPVRDAEGATYAVELDERGDGLCRIVRRRVSGEVEVVAGGDRGHADGVGTAARFDRIGSVRADPDGTLHVTDGDRVRRVTPDGVVTTLAEGLVERVPFFDPAGGGRFSRLLGIDVDPDGTVFVANYGNRRVLRITADGTVETVLSTGWLWSPTGVRRAGDVLYVLEYRVLPPTRVRVRRVGPDGVVSAVAEIP